MTDSVQIEGDAGHTGTLSRHPSAVAQSESQPSLVVRRSNNYLDFDAGAPCEASASFPVDELRMMSVEIGRVGDHSK
jgi:hypothetical protein